MGSEITFSAVAFPDLSGSALVADDPFQLALLASAEAIASSQLSWTKFHSGFDVQTSLSPCCVGRNSNDNIKRCLSSQRF